MSNLIRYIIQEDPSKKFSIDNIENSKKDYLETYRTKKSNISENWGKKIEAHLNEYMQKNKSNYPGKQERGY